MCKIAIRNAGMKQDAIAKVLTVADLWKNIERVAVLPKGNSLHWFLSARNFYWSIMVRGALSDDLIQLKVVTGTLKAQKYQDEILESGVSSPLITLDG